MGRLEEILLVGAGGFLGAVARFIVSKAANSFFGAAFPWGTFIINISGSFLLGAIATLAAERLIPHSDALRLTVAIGFIGAYTTFSTFEFESNALLEDGNWAMCLANVAGSVVVGFIALKLGIALSRRLG